jgi:hypothetical protein
MQQSREDKLGAYLGEFPRGGAALPPASTAKRLRMEPLLEPGQRGS